MAQLAVLAAALSYAFAGVYGRRFCGQNPLITATGQLVATTVVMTPIALAVDQPWNIANLEITTYGAIAGLALVSTAPAYWIYFRILASAGATNLLLVTFLMPGIAILLGVVVLRETIAFAEIYGMALIAVGEPHSAARLFSWLHDYRRSDGSWWTGYVYADSAIWPEECPTWTAGAVLLAADSLAGHTAASNVFTEVSLPETAQHSEGVHYR